MDDLFPQLFLQEAEGLAGLKSSFLLTKIPNNVRE